RIEICDARLERRLPFAEHRGKVPGLALLYLRQMLHDVANRDQSVLYVVIYLAGTPADGGASLGIAKLHGGRAQTSDHDAESPGERADFVVTAGCHLELR